MKVGEIFLQVFGFFLHHLNIDVVNIVINVFWLIKFVFITKIIPNPLKMGNIFGDIFGILFQVQMIRHKLLLKARGRLEMPMKKKKIIYFEMLEEG